MAWGLSLIHIYVLMSGTPAEVFARAEELLSAGLDVPQVTRIAMRLREQGLAIDPAAVSYTHLDVYKRQVCKVSYDLQIKTWLCSSRFIYL